MIHRSGRLRRALALSTALLVSAASAQAAFTLEPPVARGAFRGQTADDENSEPVRSDPRAISALLDSLENETGVAPRVAEARPPALMRAPTLRVPEPGLVRAAGAFEAWFAGGSGCVDLTRWCLAHATSTQAP
jgi:hypothetical protein